MAKEAGMSKTYAVEADNAEIRHDLARLSLSLLPYSAPSLHKRTYLAYPTHHKDFYTLDL